MKMRTSLVVAVVVVLLALGVFVVLGSRGAGGPSGGGLPGAPATPAIAAIRPGPTLTLPVSGDGASGAPQYGLLGPEGVPGDPYAQAPVPADNAGDEDR